ncbi:MAG: hypothetical protein ACK5TN_03605, partial [Acidobacteriota bacterium]
MNFDDEFCLAQPFGEALDFAMELLELLGRRILLWFGTAGFRREALGDGGGAFLSPVGEVRRVETLAAEKSADGAWGGGGIGGGEYLLLIGSREAAALGAGPDLRGGWLWVGGVGRGTGPQGRVAVGRRRWARDRTSG